jgi:hypothetical protein
MKVAYAPNTDTLTVILREGVAESRNLVSLEILDASRRVTDARRVEFQTID